MTARTKLLSLFPRPGRRLPGYQQPRSRAHSAAGAQGRYRGHSENRRSESSCQMTARYGMASPGVAGRVSVEAKDGGSPIAFSGRNAMARSQKASICTKSAKNRDASISTTSERCLVANILAFTSKTTLTALALTVSTGMSSRRRTRTSIWVGDAQCANVVPVITRATLLLSVRPCQRHRPRYEACQPPPQHHACSRTSAASVSTSLAYPAAMVRRNGQRLHRTTRIHGRERLVESVRDASRMGRGGRSGLGGKRLTRGAALPHMAALPDRAQDDRRRMVALDAV